MEGKSHCREGKRGLPTWLLRPQPLRTSRYRHRLPRNWSNLYWRAEIYLFRHLELQTPYSNQTRCRLPHHYWSS